MASRESGMVEDFVTGPNVDFKMPMGHVQHHFSNFAVPDMYGSKLGMPHEMENNERVLLRLRDVIDEAKRLCLRLRAVGHQTDAEAAAAELMGAVNAPLNTPWETVENRYPPGMWNHDEDCTHGGMNNFENPHEFASMQKQEEDLHKGNGKWGVSSKEKGRKGKKNGPGNASAAQGGNGNAGGNNSVWRQPNRGRDSAWAGAAAEESSTDPNEGSTFAFVEFKRGRVRKYASVPDIPPGKYVMVDGDRGQDCGLLVQTIRKFPGRDDEIVCMEGTNIDDKLKLEDGRVIRLATEDEVKRLHSVIASAEALALKTCRDRCKELNIEIGLVDVEYQYDMKKISFFFDCDHSVDFRSLVRELYRSFGARIWMENINPRVRNSMPDASNSSGTSGENGNWSGNGRNRKN